MGLIAMKEFQMIVEVFPFQFQMAFFISLCLRKFFCLITKISHMTHVSPTDREEIKI